MDSQFASLINKLESLVNRFEAAQNGGGASAQPVPASASSSSGAAGGSSTLSRLLKDFDTEVAAKAKAMEDAAAILGGDIPTIVRAFLCIFEL